MVVESSAARKDELQWESACQSCTYVIFVITPFSYLSVGSMWSNPESIMEETAKVMDANISLGPLFSHHTMASLISSLLTQRDCGHEVGDS